MKLYVVFGGREEEEAAGGEEIYMIPGWAASSLIPANPLAYCFELFLIFSHGDFGLFSPHGVLLE